MLILYIVLGVIVVALIVLTIIFFRKKKKEKAAAAAGGEVVAPGGDDISVIIHEAESKLAAAKLEQGGKVANLPVYLVMGEPGSTKTSIMLHSGLEPELLAGQVYQAGNVAPTRGVNLWFSRRSVFAEAGGPLLMDGAKWNRLVKRLQPKAAVVGKGEQAPRAAVVCFDCENFTKPGSQDIIANAARTLRARLGEISQAMGINLPVYALFTKTDRLPFFTEYVRNLSNDESTQVLGVTLPMMNQRSEGVYAEEETTRLTGNFERLFRSLADARIEFLAREGDASKLPAAYEFPREFRKIRPAVVQFLVDVCRPSQLTVGPFLRGFYFTGVRPILVNESAPVTAAPQAAAYGGPAGATGIFSAKGAQAANPAAPPPVIGTRKVPQWLFLAHLFNDILLADRGAMGASGASTKTSSARRWLFIAAASLCFLLCIFFTISFFKNRSLETQVRDAAQGITTVSGSSSDVASLDMLRRLETLRQSLELLGKYRREGSPYMYRFGLYVGDTLYPETRRIYFDRFKQAMFGQTQTAVLQNLKSLPATPVADHEYQPTYDSLKAYLITTSYHEKSTRLFLTPTLMTWWMAGRPVDPDRVALAQKQFDFYAEELKEDNPYSKENDTLAIERARSYLKQYAGMERVYNYMLAEADKVGKTANFNRDFPGSAAVVVNTKEVRGAFSTGGYKFMNDAIAHADRYFSGETWVLGEQGSASLDMAGLQRDLKARYSNDWVSQWTAYMKAAFVVRYASLKDAAVKLKQHSSNTAPLLELSSQASQNTNVPDANSKIFQPVQWVTPPENTDKYVAPSNQSYISALAQLQASIDSLSDQASNDAAVAQTLQVAKQAEATVGQIATGFKVDSPIQALVQKLLTDPITNAINALPKPGGDLNAKGKALCAQINPVFAKYPFKPSNTLSQASLQEIDMIFNPKGGVLWQFYEQNLAKVLTRQGPHFVAIPGGPVQISAAFTTFMNHAGEFTEAAYPGGVGPKFNYQVKPELTPEMQAIRLTIDGQAVTFTAANAGAKPFVWPGASQGVQLGVTFQGPKDFDVASYQGLWSVFQLVAEANKRVGNTIERTLTSGVPPRPITVPATGQPVTVRLEMIANPPIFNPGYFAFSCVSDVAR